MDYNEQNSQTLDIAEFTASQVYLYQCACSNLQTNREFLLTDNICILCTKGSFGQRDPNRVVALSALCGYHSLAGGLP